MRTRQQLERKNNIILADQHNIRRLNRQKFVLKLANRQLQNRLANIPIVAPPQPVDQIWLVFQ